MSAPEKIEIVYYELLKMEDRLSAKAEVILQTRDEIAEQLRKFELLQSDLIKKIEELKGA